MDYIIILFHFSCTLSPPLFIRQRARKEKEMDRGGREWTPKDPSPPPFLRGGEGLYSKIPKGIGMLVNVHGLYYWADRL
jgi:hypothetical protein